MNCRDIDTWAMPYLDGEIEPEVRADIEGHLAGCTPCSAQIHAEAQFRDTVRGRARAAMANARAPEGLRDRVRRGMATERRRQTALNWAGSTAAAAALGVVVAGAWSTYRHEAQAHTRDRVLTDAAGRYAKNPPLDVQGTAPATAVAFLSEQLGQGVRLPQLQNATVRGARISHVTDKPAGYVVYEVPAATGPARRVGLFVFDDSRREIPADPYPGSLANARGYNVALWRENETVYELVSDLDERDIRSLLRQEQAVPASFAVPAMPDPGFQMASYPR